ncbi:uncharacterized protein E0L32_003008 [Thyridium curvatum]|uniref:Cellulose-binding protein n=1 Tax=Thyridium curvatum TaxID=1093900 RepID=A0A507BDB0_9PEZI|nr:uncharacterized protein E0L32_003008 [Thyridium curvatum]TPX17907.1 hypothetical protein E0L32_003008 [Thyridium curvatum]
MLPTTTLQSFPAKPRVFIISDISNEPDDAESLVRYLLYSNQFQTEGLVACTSTWLRNKTCPQDMIKIIDAYAGAVDNLQKHTHPDFPYPSADYLRSIVKSGPPVYGFAVVGDDIPLSEGGDLLLERITAPDDQPLWVLCWGGVNVLAQVLLKIRNQYPADQAGALRAKLRVYTISDQDDTAAWIRTQFPDVFYISSVHGWNQYGMAAWTGISGDKYYHFDQGGPDFSKMTKEWIKDNIQIGPLGSAYPDYMFIPEGDTPTFLYLIQNGLGVPEDPSAGSWGGRYQLTDVSTAGQQARHFSDAKDVVVGQDGRTYHSNHATIWRWRDAFQNDFAARIRWSTAGSFGEGNHHPVVNVNGSAGPAPIRVEAEAGSVLRFDARETYDPDGRDGGLKFRWWHYRDPSATQWTVHFEVDEMQIRLLDGGGRQVEVQLPGPEKCCAELISRKPVPRGQVLHLILEVTDDGTPSLTSYKRIMIQTTNKDLRGGGGGGADNIADAMKEQA